MIFSFLQELSVAAFRQAVQLTIPAVGPAGSTPSRATDRDQATGSLGLPSNRIPSSLSRAFNWHTSTSLFPTKNSCPSLIGSHLTQSVVVFLPSVSMRLSEEFSLQLQLQQVISLSSDPKVKSALAPFTLFSSPHCQFKSQQAF